MREQLPVILAFNLTSLGCTAAAADAAAATDLPNGKRIADIAAAAAVTCAACRGCSTNAAWPLASVMMWC